jgi:Fic family protein
MFHPVTVTGGSRDKSKIHPPYHKRERVYSKELIELLFHQPYTKGKFLEDAGIAKRQTAAEYLKELEKIKVLKLQKTGKENLYLNVKLYDLLSR